jgi:hypothetical protein
MRVPRCRVPAHPNLGALLREPVFGDYFILKLGLLAALWLRYLSFDDRAIFGYFNESVVLVHTPTLPMCVIQARRLGRPRM